MTSFINAKEARRISEDVFLKNEEIKHHGLSLKFDWVWPKIKDAAMRGDLYIEMCVDLSPADVESLISMLRYYGYQVEPPRPLRASTVSLTSLDVRWR